jgi:hypothetical protein
MCERLSNYDTLAIDHDGDKPDAKPFEVCHHRVLELSMAVRAQQQQVAWVVTDLRIEMMYFEVWFAAPFFEGESTKLALSVVQFSK